MWKTYSGLEYWDNNFNVIKFIIIVIIIQNPHFYGTNIRYYYYYKPGTRIPNDSDIIRIVNKNKNANLKGKNERFTFVSVPRK